MQPPAKRPEWGRSFSTQQTTAAQSSQMVRLQFAKPQDVTLYLQGLYMNNAGSIGQFATKYAVTVGCGGIAIVNEDIWVPAVGRALHYTTDRIEVIGTISDSSGAALGPGSTVRLGAGVSPGRPNVSYRTGDFLYSKSAGLLPPANALTAPPVKLGWFSVIQTNTAWIRVPQWATRMRVTSKLDVGFTTAQVNVYEVDSFGDLVPLAVPLLHPTAPVTTLDNWTDWHVLAPNVQLVGFNAIAGGAGGVGSVLVEFEIVS